MILIQCTVSFLETMTTMNSDNEEYCVLDLETEYEVQPYMFEPIPRHRAEVTDSESSSEEESEEYDIQPDQAQGVPVSVWCSCDSCDDMDDAVNKCCKEYREVQAILGESKMDCITEHPGFIGNCLNPYVLEASVYEFIQENGRLGDDEPANELMRYLAYRRFIRWVFGWLGRHNRRIIPACAVKKIREAFPADFYIGFRHAVW